MSDTRFVVGIAVTPTERGPAVPIVLSVLVAPECAVGGWPRPLQTGGRVDHGIADGRLPPSHAMLEVHEPIQLQHATP